MTRQKLIFYWAVYALMALLALLLQSVILNRLSFRSVHPFLLPCLVALTSIYTPRKGSACFAFLFGLLCDMLLVGPFSFFYLLCFSLCALGIGWLSHRFISPGVLCTLLMGTISLLFTGLMQMFFLSFQAEIPFLSGMLILLIELVITLPFLLCLYPLYSRVDRFLANV